jgi:hypothetical protein
MNLPVQSVLDRDLNLAHPEYKSDSLAVEQFRDEFKLSFHETVLVHRLFLFNSVHF